MDQMLEQSQEAKPIEIEAEDANGISVKLRFVGEVEGPGVYSNSQGDVILVPDEAPFAKWTKDDRDQDPDSFANGVWETVSSVEGRAAAGPDVAMVLATFGVTPVIDL